MNENIPPLFEDTSSMSDARTKGEPPLHLSLLLVGLMTAVAFFDTCFWGANSMGFSLAIFDLALVGTILANRERENARRTSHVLLALVIGAVFSAMLETGTTNTLVLLALIITLAGQTYFQNLGSFWGRELSQIAALTFAPGRIFWLAAQLIKIAFGKAWVAQVV